MFIHVSRKGSGEREEWFLLIFDNEFHQENAFSFKQTNF